MRLIVSICFLVQRDSIFGKSLGWHNACGTGIPAELFQLFPVLKQMLRRRGDMAILLCEQYYDVAAELADDFFVMERCGVVARGVAADMQRDNVRQLVAI